MPTEKAATNGRDKLEVKVVKDPAAAKEAGISVGMRKMATFVFKSKTKGNVS